MLAESITTKHSDVSRKKSETLSEAPYIDLIFLIPTEVGIV